MNINSRGQILHGVGNGVAAIDNRAFAHGAAGGWFDDTTAFFADADSNWAIALYYPTTGRRRAASENLDDPLFGKGANTMYAGGGVWAAWLAGTGLFTSTGFRLEAGGLLGVGPDGAIAYKPDYHALGPSLLIEQGRRGILHLTDGHAADLQLLGEGRAIWQERNWLRTRGLPGLLLQIGAVWRPQAFKVDGRWWVSYYSDRAGIVLHPVDDAREGYIISPAGVDCWHTARQLADGTIRFALSSGEAEQPGQVRSYDVDFTQPTTPIDKQAGPVNTTTPAAHVPAPVPIDPPAGAPPADPVPPHHPGLPPAHTKGLLMDIDGKVVQLRGAGGLLVAPGPTNTGTWGSLNQGWRGVLYVADGGAGTRHLAAKLANGRYSFLNVDHHGFAGADGGQYSPALDQQGYYMPDGKPGPGPLEQWEVYDGNANGAIEAQIEQVTDDKHPAGAGKKFFVFPLTVEVVS